MAKGTCTCALVGDGCLPNVDEHAALLFPGHRISNCEIVPWGEHQGCLLSATRRVGGTSYADRVALARALWVWNLRTCMGNRAHTFCLDFRRPGLWHVGAGESSRHFNRGDAGLVRLYSPIGCLLVFFNICLPAELRRGSRLARLLADPLV